MTALADALTWTCHRLVKIALEHSDSRRDATRCGICRTRWPCHTYRLATGDPDRDHR